MILSDVLGMLGTRFTRVMCSADQPGASATTAPGLGERAETGCRNPLSGNRIDAKIDEVSDFVMIATFVLGCAGFIWQIRIFTHQVKESRLAVERATEEAIEENRRQCRRYTLEFIGNTIARQYDLYSKVHADDGFLERAKVPNSEEYMGLRSYLGYLENIAAGVNMGIFDQEVVDHTAGARLIKAWEQYSGWVEAVREAQGNKRMYEELEVLVRRLPPLNPPNREEDAADDDTSVADGGAALARAAGSPPES
ncbi:DUF4760 domain-containing protein [Nocardia carnea]|uniref:DUF4760 domain-containing protein n=1 Tax=Nocardia carnea TaxID=37328 RepID=UPI0024541C92|nr:DUF4760 domain-containing protein [Nocardia carnea]